MITVTQENFVNAFNAHRQIAQNGDLLSHKLLRVYAAECVVKAKFLKENNLRDTSQIPKNMYSNERGHNMTFWLKKLKTANFCLSEPETNNGKFPIRALHEYLRYDVRLPDEVLKSQMQFVKEIITIFGKER